MGRLFPQRLATGDPAQFLHPCAAVRVHRADRAAASFSQDRPIPKRR
jgi:hypothetical protein